MAVPLSDCPQFNGRVFVYHSAIARFYAPSNLCGAGGMCHEYIRSTPLWQGEYPRHNMVFVTTDSEHDGFMGMCIGRVYLFFSFVYKGIYYPCALVHWFVPVGETVHDETGQWVVKPEFVGNGPSRQQHLAVIHIDSIARGALLSPVYGSRYLPDDFHFSFALDAFHSYFVNNYADHHMNEFIPKIK